EQCQQISAYVGSLPPPVQRVDGGNTSEQATSGKKLFSTTGCADCHTPNLGSVEGIYSDLLLHRMGPELEGGGYYAPTLVVSPDGRGTEGPAPREWRTPPLWGVADSGPYLHDGRAATLEDAIKLHGGQGKPAAQRFESLTPQEKGQLLAF